MPKPTRTAAELQRMLLERIATVPDLAGQETDVHRGGVRWVDPGEGGPNWTVPVLSERTIHRSDIARFIRELQMRHDLEE
jgi:hypothetical protein